MFNDIGVAIATPEAAGLYEPGSFEPQPQTTIIHKRKQVYSLNKPIDDTLTSSATLIRSPDAPELDMLEIAEATPRALDSEPLSPRQPAGRLTLGRRPLSLLSNSSLNSSSDLSPPLDMRARLDVSLDFNLEPRLDRFFDANRLEMREQLVESKRRRLGILDPGTPVDRTPQLGPFDCPFDRHSDLYRMQGLFDRTSTFGGPLDRHISHTKSPEWSPGKHRRHRSVIGTSVDFQYATPTNSHASLCITPYPPNYPAYPAHDNPSGNLNNLNGNGNSGSRTASYDSMTPTTPQEDSQQDWQEVFVALAYKERQVLEAQQRLDSAKEDLQEFRHRLDAVLVPRQISVPLRPTNISRRHTPLVGIHALQLARISLSQSASEQPRAPRVVSWRIDVRVPSKNEPPNMDEIDHEDVDGTIICYGDDSQDGFSLRAIKFLLGIVHSVISTLPVHQRNFQYQKYRAIDWVPDYPMPMDTFYGHLLYDEC